MAISTEGKENNMKIIEALKELPLIKKKINTNRQRIADYCCLYSFEDSPFGDIGDHQKNFDSLLQSSEDLVKRYERIKLALSITNAGIKVTINNEEKTIAEWITYRTETGEIQKSIYKSLQVETAQARLRNTAVDLDKGLKRTSFYDEKKRNDNIDHVEDLLGSIDAKLEVVNATTDLSVEV